MKNHSAFILLTTILYLLSGCTNNDAQQEFEQEAYRQPENITETDFDGDVIENDDNDWRISPFHISLIEVSPIFPNPLSFGSQSSLEITLRGARTSILELGYLTFDNRWTPLQTLEVPNEFDQKTFIITPEQFGTNDQARGYHRLILFDGNQRIVTYGDILIE